MKLQLINEATVKAWHVSIDGIKKFDNSKPVVFFTDESVANNYRKVYQNRTKIEASITYNRALKTKNIKHYYNNPDELTKSNYDAAISNTGANTILITDPKNQVKVLKINNL